MYKPIRVQFCKTGAAAYFSHLDLTRTVMRLLRKSGIDFWYTEGFSPHPYVVFAAPLSLGMESECEIFEFKGGVDFGLREKILLKSAFPDCLKIIDVYESARKFKEIQSVRWQLTLSGTPELAPLLKEPMPVIKKTKRSEKETDVRDYISDPVVTVRDGNTVLQINIGAGENNLNPSYLLAALADKNVDVSGACVKRLQFLDGEKKPFK